MAGGITLFSADLHVDGSEVLRTLASYPYNILAGAVAIGTGLVLVRRYFSGGVCKSKAKLTGKTVIITGANTGIGKETAIDLAKRKAKVIIACRNPERGQYAEREIRQRSGSEEVIYYHLDLASLESVRQFAELILQEEPRLDILINNAGIMACPQWKTEDGFDMQFGVNHLGHFLLTNLLLDRLKESPSGRIINVTSSRYKVIDGLDYDDLNSEQNYDPFLVYCRSKLANILFTHALAKRLRGTSVTVNCLHPGVCWTELLRHIEKRTGFLRKLLMLPVMLLIFKTPRQGAQTSIYCAVADEVSHVSGKYFGDCRLDKLETAAAKDDEAAERLWAASTRLVGLKKSS